MLVIVSGGRRVYVRFAVRSRSTLPTGQNDHASGGDFEEGLKGILWMWAGKLVSKSAARPNPSPRLCQGGAAGTNYPSAN